MKEKRYAYKKITESYFGEVKITYVQTDVLDDVTADDRVIATMASSLGLGGCICFVWDNQKSCLVDKEKWEQKSNGNS
ncbi:MAG TPA: hypothetical protein VFC76_01015 [Oscillospiraceae bacterium]|nr:hypothetical protein [Oscillospiraceae bacterium]